ncbi:FliC/FljB family flagellin [Cupriavidus pinatubonensis]|uniref:Flagellin n=1 Tax=Cupriavidus pinatubonensis TaxID=248026 RepID=A0ABM8XFK7_9BURK|nr:FliC/FljB family flagellin [Cupriavidus pinatubonensis]CAG9178919.1 Flagellin 2 [Cupriavidus pinatubonensis]
MAQVINTNSLSLMTQNNLNASQSQLNTAIQRLSSGLRINSAKDDAAGQAIANRFTANIRGLTQAQRNANDGISLAQTTEGALTEVNNNLQRIRELSVQAANGSNSGSDLASVQAEIKQRLDEIDRVSSQTQFNGVKVLASDSQMSVQVGANDGETISINLKQINATTLGLNTLNVAGPAGTPAAYSTGTGAVQGRDNTGKTVDVASADIGGTGVDKLTDSSGAVTTLTSADLYKDSNGRWFAKDTTGNYYAATVTVQDAAQGSTAANPTAIVTFDSNKPLSAATANPLAAIDSALSKVDDLRSSLGAVQNRFDSAIANLGTTVTNLSASRSRIQDADYATEVSNMTRANILQQAGTSVLAQANQTTQGVLSLLR